MEYRLNRQNRPRILDFLARLDMAKDWVITIEPFRKKRSLGANARLWKLHSLVADVTGYSAEEMHEFALCRFYGYEDKKCGGVTRRMPLERSSTKDVKKFAEFMEATEIWYLQEFAVWMDADVRQEDIPQRKAA